MVQSLPKFTSERDTKDPSNALPEQQPHKIFLSYQNSFLHRFLFVYYVE